MFINDKDITYINNITDKLYQYKPFIFVLMKKKKKNVCYFLYACICSRNSEFTKKILKIKKLQNCFT